MAQVGAGSGARLATTWGRQGLEQDLPQVEARSGADSAPCGGSVWGRTCGKWRKVLGQTLPQVEAESAEGLLSHMAGPTQTLSQVQTGSCGRPCPDPLHRPPSLTWGDLGLTWIDLRLAWR